MLICKAKNSGFTVLELIVVMAIVGILAAIALPNFSSIQGQLSSSQEVRQMAYQLGLLRKEAIRLRTNVRVSFSATGYSWDIYDDNVSEGSVIFKQEVSWSGASVPSDIVFNGLGLLRSSASDVTFSVESKGYVSSVTLNTNGHIQM